MEANRSTAEFLFRRAQELRAEDRPAFLTEACGSDLSLRRQVETLLTAHNQTSDSPPDALDGGATLVEPTPRQAALQNLDEVPGTIIGRFKLLEKLGEGGFGTVWAAEQREPVKRRVALKIIKLGMDTKQVVARFEAERQALALMDHPNIAKVFDAGATESGRPYFAMELVRGIPITKFCDEKKLDATDRLELFIKVCHAIQHAHQKGIIHRDIKPSNILVTLHDGVPVPKVIDFGIAKATQQELTEKTIYTQVQQFIGTPAYMSPEQAEMSGLDIDTRSDIYSLGVLLYELLTGTTPFDAKELMASGLDAMRNTIREKEPLRPSTRLSQSLVAADVRRLQSPSLDKPATEEEVRASSRQLLRAKETIALLRGDLDWIVMKCLEKDRTRRYDTATALAADLKRHLGNEPVLARPPSAIYRFQKAIRRHKLVFAATAAVSFALSFGLSASILQAIRATRAERAVKALFDSEREAKQAATQAQSAAVTERDNARRNLYAAKINLAHQAWLESNLGKARRLLLETTPGPGEEDLREWEWRYLWGLVRGDDAGELAKFNGGVFHLEFANRDRNLLISLTGSGAEERGAFVFDLEEGKLRNRRSLGQEAFSSAAGLEAKGQLLVHRREANTTNVLALLDRDSLEAKGRFVVPGHVRAMAISPDESLVAAYHGARSVVILDSGSGSNIAVIRAEVGSPHFGRLAFLPDGARLAIGFLGGKLQIVRARTGEVLRDLPAHTNGITALAVAPKAAVLATGAGFAETKVKIWNADTGEPIQELAGHRAWIASLAFSPDGTVLASASADQTIRLWDTTTWKEIATLRGHEDEIYCLAFAKGGRQLVSGAKDGSVRLWQVPPQTRHFSERVLPEAVGYSVVSPDSRRLVTLAADYVVWDTQTGEKLETLTALRGYRAAYDFTPDNRQLLVGGQKGKVRVWDFARNALTEFDAGGEDDVAAVHSLGGTNYFITVQGSQIKMWSQTGRKLSYQYQLKPSGPAQTSVAFASTGAIATGHGDGSVSLSDSKTGVLITNFPAHRRIVVGLAFSADAKLLATGGEEGLAKLWDLATFREIAALKGHLKSIHSLTISASGRRLATGGSGAEAIKIWDLRTQQELMTLGGGSALLRALSFSPDGNVLVGRTETGRLHLWRAPSWNEIEEAEAGKRQRLVSRD
jgi:WD40 repeat protein/serine/threonine protein kinase